MINRIFILKKYLLSLSYILYILPLMFTISSLISENKYNNHLIQNFVYGEDYNTFNENINPINLDVTEIDDFTLLIYMIGSDLEDKSYEATKDINEMLKTNLFN